MEDARTVSWIALGLTIAVLAPAAPWLAPGALGQTGLAPETGAGTDTAEVRGVEASFETADVGGEIYASVREDSNVPDTNGSEDSTPWVCVSVHPRGHEETEDTLCGPGKVQVDRNLEKAFVRAELEDDGTHATVEGVFDADDEGIHPLSHDLPETRSERQAAGEAYVDHSEFGRATTRTGEATIFEERRTEVRGMPTLATPGDVFDVFQDDEDCCAKNLDVTKAVDGPTARTWTDQHADDGDGGNENEKERFVEIRLAVEAEWDCEFGLPDICYPPFARDSSVTEHAHQFDEAGNPTGDPVDQSVSFAATTPGEAVSFCDGEHHSATFEVVYQAVYEDQKAVKGTAALEFPNGSTVEVDYEANGRTVEIDDADFDE